MTRKPSGPIGQMEMEKGPIGTRELLGPTGRMVPLVHMTRKPSGPTGRMEMENGPTGTHDM